MGGASDAWVTYDKSTARSVYFQLRAFAAFDPHALSNACGPKGVMLRFGGMTLDADTATCYGKEGWGQTGATCHHMGKIAENFFDVVTQQDDDAFFAQAGAPGFMTLETDRAIATISLAEGVTVKEKSQCNEQPTLNFPWRCEAQGGISDQKSCLWNSPSPPSPTPPPAPSPSPPTPSPRPPMPGTRCKVGDPVKCPNSGVMCEGNQCCRDGSTCPSAEDSFKGCQSPKESDCTKQIDAVTIV